MKCLEIPRCFLSHNMQWLSVPQFLCWNLNTTGDDVLSEMKLLGMWLDGEGVSSLLGHHEWGLTRSKYAISMTLAFTVSRTVWSKSLLRKLQPDLAISYCSWSSNDSNDKLSAVRRIPYDLMRHSCLHEENLARMTLALTSCNMKHGLLHCPGCRMHNQTPDSKAGGYFPTQAESKRAEGKYSVWVNPRNYFDF